MRPLTSLLRSVLRAVTMALLLLGVLSSPVLAYAGDLHYVGHASVASASGADEHVESGSDGHTGCVWHALMHAGHGQGAATAAFHVRMILAVQQTRAAALPPTAPLTPLQRIAGPFRPPIV